MVYVAMHLGCACVSVFCIKFWNMNRVGAAQLRAAPDDVKKQKTACLLYKNNLFTEF
jgi:hypothetical protein